MVLAKFVANSGGRTDAVRYDCQEPRSSKWRYSCYLGSLGLYSVGKTVRPRRPAVPDPVLKSRDYRAPGGESGKGGIPKIGEISRFRTVIPSEVDGPAWAGSRDGSSLRKDADCRRPPTADLSTTGSDSQASRFLPHNMTRGAGQLNDARLRPMHPVWLPAKLPGRQACRSHAPSRDRV